MSVSYVMMFPAYIGIFIHELIESDLSDPWCDITMPLPVLPSTTTHTQPQSHQITLNLHLLKEVDFKVPLTMLPKKDELLLASLL